MGVAVPFYCLRLWPLNRLSVWEKGAKNFKGDSEGEMEEPSSYPVIVAMTTHFCFAVNPELELQ